MIAETLSIGTELLLGEIHDTNSAFLARDLATRGIDVYWSGRVGDNRRRIVQALEQATERSDLVLLCGGLGPTDDDMTREAIAELVGETPAVDAALERDLRGHFERMGRVMPERNLKQAWLVPSAEALPNPLGTAPGWFVRLGRGGRERVIAALPGPPRELHRMWFEEVVPRLALPEAALFTRTYKTHGLGESGVAERLGDLTLAANPSVATYARRDGVQVRVAAKAATRADAEAVAQPALEAVEAALGGLVWGRDGDELPALVVAALRATNQRVATMESLTGGMLTETLTSVAGASNAVAGGVIAYTPQAKASFGVPEALLRQRGSVSGEVAGAMAEAAARSFDVEFGLATTGVAGPEASEGHEPGVVYVALRSSSGTKVVDLRLPPLQRDWIRERATYATLSLLFRHLHS